MPRINMLPSRDFTFVCPTEILAFNDSLDAFKELNTAVLGEYLVSFQNFHFSAASLGMRRFPKHGASRPSPDIFDIVSACQDMLTDHKRMPCQNVFSRNDIALWYALGLMLINILRCLDRFDLLPLRMGLLTPQPGRPRSQPQASLDR